MERQTAERTEKDELSGLPRHQTCKEIHVNRAHTYAVNRHCQIVRLARCREGALGGPAPAEEGCDSAYWMVRAAMSKAISEAAAYLTERGEYLNFVPIRR